MTGIAAEFPDVPHRYCDNHFLRDVAKPVLEADSHAKVQMRKKVRGLRKIEQAVLKQQGVQASERIVEDDSAATAPPLNPPGPRVDAAAPWCSNTARRCVAFSTTIREDRSTLPACGWPMRWMRFARRSSETWTRKKGIRRAATGPTRQLHRPRPKRSAQQTGVDPSIAANARKLPKRSIPAREHVRTGRRSSRGPDE